MTVALAPLALPSLTATTTATTRDGLLIVDDHGFSLRLGRVALVGFNAAALAPRLPAQATADTDGLITEVVKLAHAKDSDGSDVAGCAAFNALLCPIAGGDQTCLSAACSDGLGALIARAPRRVRRRERERARLLPRRLRAGAEHAGRRLRPSTRLEHGRDGAREVVGGSPDGGRPLAAEHDVRRPARVGVGPMANVLDV